MLGLTAHSLVKRQARPDATTLQALPTVSTCFPTNNNNTLHFDFKLKIQRARKLFRALRELGSVKTDFLREKKIQLGRSLLEVSQSHHFSGSV